MYNSPVGRSIVIICSLLLIVPIAHAMCQSPRMISSVKPTGEYSYIVNPALASPAHLDGRRTVSENLRAQFWSLGQGSPLPRSGADSGTLGPDRWVSSFPDSPAFINTTWATDAAIDGCFYETNPDACLAVLIADTDDFGRGYFAFVAIPPDSAGDYWLTQPGNAPIVLAPIPVVEITGMQQQIASIFIAGYAQGLYIDEACTEVAAPTYRILQATSPEGQGPPTSRSIDSFGEPTWRAARSANGAESHELGSLASIATGCSPSKDTYVAATLSFDSGYELPYVGEPTRVACEHCIGEDRDGDGYCVDDRDPLFADCDDNDATIHPGAYEACDGKINDCLSVAWPSLSETRESDDDGDGFTECQGDCDDSVSTIYPSAPELCDELPNDCTDPNWPSVADTEYDADGDGISVCSGDCDDRRATVYPGAPEICDRLNNDCLDARWPGLPAFEIDGDGDRLSACQGDCDDQARGIHPTALEWCNSRDDDCDGIVDETAVVEGTNGSTASSICNVRRVADPGTPDAEGRSLVDRLLVRFDCPLSVEADGVSVRFPYQENHDTLTALGVWRIEYASMLRYQREYASDSFHSQTYRLFIASANQRAEIEEFLRSLPIVEEVYNEDLALPAQASCDPDGPSDPEYCANQYRHFGWLDEQGFELDDHDVDGPQGWAISTGGPRVTIAIVDSGLAETALSRPSQIGDFDSERVLTGVDVGGAYTPETPGIPVDSSGHGTKVASVALAKGDNEELIAGTCWGCQIVPVGRGEGDVMDVVEAIEWVVDPYGTYHPGYRIDVFNMSFGAPNCSACGEPSSSCDMLRIELDKAETAGLIAVASSGNENSSTVTVPAVCKNVIAVGATDDDDSRWNVPGGQGSNYAPELDVVAPGVGMSVITTDGESELVTGTSFAAPVVSGLLGLVKSVNPSIGYFGAWKAALYSSEDRKGIPEEDTPGRDDYHGYGRVNLQNALEWTQADMSLAFTNETVIGLEHTVGFRSDETYDLLRGDLSALPFPNIETECLGSQSAAIPSWSHSAVPPQDNGYFYLSRINLPESLVGGSYNNFRGEWGGNLESQGKSLDRNLLTHDHCQGSGLYVDPQ